MVDRWTMLVGGLLLGALAGCDDGGGASAPPPATEPDVTAMVESADASPSDTPTTQELVSGPRKTIQAGFFPVTLHVPESWTLSTLDNGQVLLQGRSPSGEVAMQIARRPATTSDKIEILVMGAKKEMTDKPGEVKKVELRDKGSIKIFERQSVGTRSLPVSAAADGDLAADPGPLFRWTTTYFIPSGEQFDSYDLSFVALPVRQYEADREFLQGIVDSVEFSK